MFKVSGLNVSIGPVPVIRNVSLAMEEGEMCGLIGRNGAGKTTLMRALMGALPASGTAALGDIELLSRPGHERVHHGIGYMPEDRRRVVDAIDLAIRERRGFHFNARMSVRGAARVIETIGDVKIDDDGMVRELFGVARDISSTVENVISGW